MKCVAAAPDQGTADNTHTTRPIVTPRETIGTQIRRRREESRRGLELEDGTGRRDPIDPIRKRRQPITVRVLPPWTAEADGPGVVTILDRLDIKKMRAVHGGMWQFPLRHLDDFCAYADHLGIKIDATL